MEKLNQFKKDGQAVLTVTFWVVRLLAGVLAANAQTYKCSIKHVSFTVGAVVGFLVIGQVIWEVHTMVRNSQDKKTK